MRMYSIAKNRPGYRVESYGSQSQRRPALIHILQIAQPFEILRDLGLVMQQLSIRLILSLLSKRPPPLEILRVPLIPMRFLGVVPVTRRETEESGDLLVGDVVDERADRTGFFEPVALPELAWADALIVGCLVVHSSCHGPAVDLVCEGKKKGERGRWLSDETMRDELGWSR